MAATDWREFICVMNKEFASHFADEWLHAWNAHDLDRVLSHFSDDFEMISPIIAQVMGIKEGRLKGKDVVVAYWAKTLAMFPDLAFTPICTLIGVDSITIHCIGAKGRRVAEVFQFNVKNQVIRAHAHYEV